MSDPQASTLPLAPAFPRAGLVNRRVRTFHADQTDQTEHEQCCASCGARVSDEIDYEIEVAFCDECRANEYDEDYCDLGGEG